MPPTNPTKTLTHTQPGDYETMAKALVTIGAASGEVNIKARRPLAGQAPCMPAWRGWQGARWGAWAGVGMVTGAIRQGGPRATGLLCPVGHGARSTCFDSCQPVCLSHLRNRPAGVCGRPGEAVHQPAGHRHRADCAGKLGWLAGAGVICGGSSGMEPLARAFVPPACVLPPSKGPKGRQPRKEPKNPRPRHPSPHA